MTRKKRSKKQKNKKISGLGRFFSSAKERYYILENLSTLVAANVNVLDAFDSIKGEIRSKYLIQILEDVSNRVQKGTPLWRAMGESGLFPESIISLIRIGEESGHLPQNLILVAERNRKNRSFRSKIRSAMLYPIFVLGVAGFVGIGISWFILPKLANVFGQLKIELPIMTRIIIKMGELLGEYGQIIVPVALVFLTLFILTLFVFKRTKHIGQWLLLRTPGIGRLIREVETARFGYLLGILSKAGISFPEALESLSHATQTRSYKKFYAYLHDIVAHGHTIQHAFKTYSRSRKLIAGPVQQMVITGEQSGNLPEVLLSISSIYEGKIEITTKNISVLLEPILLVVVWFGVMTIALSVILPIYSLLGGVQ